jgi:hypothetical protein
MDNLDNQKLAQILMSMKDEDLAKMTHADLYRMRGMANPDQQNKIGPYEHRAFAREVVGDNPLMSLPVAAAIPLYSGYKALGFGRARSQPSMDEITQGLLGIGEGFKNKLGSLL